MIKNLSSFRFSKNISHRFLKNYIKNITPINISKRTFVINGKDLYYPKYGTSWYEPQDYDTHKQAQHNIQYSSKTPTYEMAESEEKDNIICDKSFENIKLNSREN